MDLPFMILNTSETHINTFRHRSNFFGEKIIELTKHIGIWNSIVEFMNLSPFEILPSFYIHLRVTEPKWHLKFYSTHECCFSNAQITATSTNAKTLSSTTAINCAWTPTTATSVLAKKDTKWPTTPPLSPATVTLSLSKMPTLESFEMRFSKAWHFLSQMAFITHCGAHLKFKTVTRSGQQPHHSLLQW